MAALKIAGIAIAALVGVSLIVAAFTPSAKTTKPAPTAGGAAPATASAPDYPQTVMREAATMHTSMIVFAKLMNDPRFDDEDWRVDVATQLSIWHRTFAEAKNLDVPARFAPFQSCWLAGLDETDKAGERYARGIDSMQPTTITVANSMLDAGQRELHGCSRILSGILSEGGR